MLTNKIFQYFKDYFILFFFVTFIFLFSLKINLIYFRYLILLLLLPCGYFFLQDLKNKNFNFLKYLFYILLFFLLHTVSVYNYEISKINLYQIFSLIYLLVIITISYYFFIFFNRNIFKLIFLFLILFLISCLISLFNFQYDAPYFCGGLPDFFNIMSHDGINSNRIYSTRISFKEYLFQENSHLGMIAPSAIIFLIYYLFKNKISFTKKYLIILFLLICFIKSSTTLIVGLFVSLTFILIFNYKDLSKKHIFSFVLIVLACVSTLIFNIECKKRFTTVKDYSNLIPKTNLEVNKNIENNILKNDNEFSILTKAVHFYALSIMKKSITEKPFGWGLNGYINAFDYFSTKYEPKQKNLKNYNKKDGTNNLKKIIVEFGVFGVFFYFFIFLFAINKKISIELKLFYLPIIITQSVRGAGYFNGGFILIAFLMLFTYINLYKKLR